MNVKITRYRKHIRYFIEMVGMSSEGIGLVTIDRKYALILVHPTLKEIVLYTNCLAYEHDLPILSYPSREKF